VRPQKIMLFSATIAAIAIVSCISAIHIPYAC
jgi:hypothetical protein